MVGLRFLGSSMGFPSVAVIMCVGIFMTTHLSPALGQGDLTRSLPQQDLAWTFWRKRSPREGCWVQWLPHAFSLVKVSSVDVGKAIVGRKNLAGSRLEANSEDYGMLGQLILWSVLFKVAWCCMGGKGIEGTDGRVGWHSGWGAFWQAWRREFYPREPAAQNFPLTSIHTFLSYSAHLQCPHNEFFFIGWYWNTR